MGRDAINRVCVAVSKLPPFLRGVRGDQGFRLQCVSFNTYKLALSYSPLWR